MLDVLAGLADVERDPSKPGRAPDARSLVAGWAIMFYTGLRIGEMRLLEWSNISLTHRRITVTKSKTAAGEGRELFIPTPLLTILRAYQGDMPRIGLVFPSDTKPGRPRSDNYFRRNAADAWKPTGLPVLTPHEARHTFASWAIKSGHSLPEISKYLGHANLLVTAAYIQTLPDDRATSEVRWDAFFADAV
jgi:integrase